MCDCFEMKFDQLNERPKLLLVETDKVLLTTLANALHARRYGIVGAAIGSDVALDYFDRIRPDVVILESDLGGGSSGVDLAIQLRSKFPMLGVFFLASMRDTDFLSLPPKLVKNSFFLNKQRVTRMDTIESGIRESIRLIRFPEEKSHQIFSCEEGEDSLAISQSDFELLKLIAAGLSNKAIAAAKSITVKSCENAIARLAKKIDVPYASDTNQRIMLARKFFEYKGKID